MCDLYLKTFTTKPYGYVSVRQGGPRKLFCNLHPNSRIRTTGHSDCAFDHIHLKISLYTQLKPNIKSSSIWPRIYINTGVMSISNTITSG